VIVAYVSGHGFGHSTRVAEVLRAVRRQAPGCVLAVVTSAPQALYQEVGLAPFLYRGEEIDVGLVQRGALEIDAHATGERWRQFVADFGDRVRSEGAWLRAEGAQVVLGDIPPLGFAAAAEAGVPALALGNFSWDWIFRHLSRYDRVLEEAAEWAARAYAGVDLLMRLPFHGDLGVFPRIEDVPLVARRPGVSREEARRRLEIPARPAVLLSFGGLRLPNFDWHVLGGLKDVVFLTTEAVLGPPNVQVVNPATLTAAHLSYVDLVGAADAVLTKPGYGIVSDCIGAGTRILYTERGDFPEYPILVAGMSRVLPCAHVSNRDLREGRIGGEIADLITRPVPPPPDMSGAETVARRLLKMRRS